MTLVRQGSGEGRRDRGAGALVPGAAEPGVRGRAQKKRGRGRDVHRVRSRGNRMRCTKAAMAGFLLLEILVFILGLWGTRGGEESAGDSRGVRGFGEKSKGRRLGSFSRSRFVTCIWAGKSFVPVIRVFLR